MSDEERVGAKVRGRPFQPGNKYGRGRPPGSRNKATGLFQKTLERYAESLAKKLVHEAFQGNPTAMRLCAEWFKPARLRFKLPRTRTVDDVGAASEALLDGVTGGQLTLAEGRALTEMLEGRRRLIDKQVQQRDAEDGSNRPVRVVVLPQIVPTKEEEIQEMALPNDRRYRGSS